MKEFQGNIKEEFKNVNDNLDGIPKKIEDAKYNYQAAMYKNNSTDAVASGSNVKFTNEIFNTLGDKVIFNDDGTIEINHTGFIKVSFFIWIYCAVTTARPWIKFERVADKEVFINCIGDNSSSYACHSASDVIIPVIAGQKFKLYCETTGNVDFAIDTGAGFKNSFITIELL